MSAAYGPHDRERWVGEDPALKRTDRDDFARDRGRLIHSAALRRLAAKTQVLAPDSDDFVRNRLTHSLEVAQIGREFGAALGCDADLVEVACLAHDLGHPPFGHNGERALDELCDDIGGFEGNAQTLRILTRLEPKRFHADGRPAGLNLTRASLDSSVKYPWERGDRETPKFGAYADDLPVFDWVRAGRGPGERCLEADVMDWSDDVAYSVHDVEDAVASGRLDPGMLGDPDEIAGVLSVAHGVYAADLSASLVADAWARLVAAGMVPRSYDGSRRDRAALKDLASRLIGRFVLASEAATREVYGAGPLTRYAARLVVPEETRAEVAVLKAVAAHFVMYAPDRLTIQERQREVIKALVAGFEHDPTRLAADFRADHDQAVDDAARRRVVADQVASLTDPSAWAFARAWGFGEAAHIH
ncbi:deoxyguanosinetriphosphate triphosphohydrolase [Nostocoides australiense]|mgnify:CR=1 FL=1|nr:deoxyguanosinetriphosphate triphosphohydrolase [Tetrasphaera australiensis]HRW03311.1 deoxyguanosinetriphosphate triphosphohydrolase [Tetrasphaera sp.]